MINLRNAIFTVDHLKGSLLFRLSYKPVFVTPSMAVWGRKMDLKKNVCQKDISATNVDMEESEGDKM